MKNGIFQMKEAFAADIGGYGFTKIIPDKNLYIEFNRINPESLWGGYTRYKLTFYNLTTNEKKSVKETKFKYEHFEKLEQNGLIDEIRAKEPALLNF